MRVASKLGASLSCRQRRVQGKRRGRSKKGCVGARAVSVGRGNEGLGRREMCGRPRTIRAGPRSLDVAPGMASFAPGIGQEAWQMRGGGRRERRPAPRSSAAASRSGCESGCVARNTARVERETARFPIACHTLASDVVLHNSKEHRENILSDGDCELMTASANLL